MKHLVTVRAREPDDLEAITELFNQPGAIAGTLQLPFRSREFQRSRMERTDSDAYILVAETDGRVVGQASLHVALNPRRRLCADIGMAVHDDFQNRGVGTALMEALLDLADNWLGLRRVELQVYTDNAAGIHLYQKFGFKIEGTARYFAIRAGHWVDAHFMARIRGEV